MRRIALVFLLLVVGLLAGCSSVGSSVLLGRDIQFTAPQLQAQLDRKFPRDYRKLGGLVSISLLNPRLSVPGGGRLQMAFDLGVSGMGGNSRNPSGHFTIESGLRFDATSRGLHLDNPRILNVDVPALGGALNGRASEMLNSWLLDYAREEPVYQLDDTALGRIAARRLERVQIDYGVITLKLE
ncbi:MAG: DUF1439 domain-containing protein [Pseudomonadota bacterium]|nr:DUF1439 domain-containing protein [Pseudomonadota bacterium]MDQ3160177.1 DUF1439 domain-containing protein [Pseudomonadota bacterium]